LSNASSILLSQPTTISYSQTNLGTTPFYTAVGTAQNWRGNNTYWNLNLPFAFSFYGQSYSSVSVSSEGFLQFAGPNYAGDGANSTAELLANTRIAPLWDNLRTNGTGNDIFVDTSTAGQVTIRWNATNEADNSTVNFAVVLFSDGRIRFDYGAGNTNLTPTIGISRGNGQQMLLTSYNGQATLTNANSTQFGFVPSFADIGAYEFQGSSLDTTPPTVVSTTPGAIASGGIVPSSINQIAVVFSEPLNVIDANASANYELRSAGPDDVFGNGDDVVYTLAPNYLLGGTTLTLNVASGALPDGRYRLTIFSNSSSSVHDQSGNALDGDQNGTAGGNYVRTFSVDTTGPRVTGVLVDGTNWTSSYLSNLQSNGLGNGAGYAIPVGSAAQLNDLPWTNLNQIQIAFNEDVNVQQASLALTGVNVANYAISGFSYNATTHVATWTLASRIGGDRLHIDLQSTGVAAVTDSVGDALDGEWTNGVSSYPSGNGTAGGDFQFAFNVLPGDGNQDGAINGLDLSNTLGHWLQENPFIDSNADGTINGLDLSLILGHWLQTNHGGAGGGGSIGGGASLPLEESATSPLMPATAASTTTPTSQVISNADHALAPSVTASAVMDSSFAAPSVATDEVLSLPPVAPRSDDALAAGSASESSEPPPAAAQLSPFATAVAPSIVLENAGPKALFHKTGVVIKPLNAGSTTPLVATAVDNVLANSNSYDLLDAPASRFAADSQYLFASDLEIFSPNVLGSSTPKALVKKG
jgi:hypothetical protein